jgi:hypothetical protein
MTLLSWVPLPPAVKSTLLTDAGYGRYRQVVRQFAAWTWLFRLFGAALPPTFQSGFPCRGSCLKAYLVRIPAETAGVCSVKGCAEFPGAGRAGVRGAAGDALVTVA